MTKLLSTFVISSFLLMPLGLKAENRHNDDKHIQKYYDSQHGDYHTWSDSQRRDYQEYARRHHTNKEFERLNKREQSLYWNQYHHQHRKY